MRGVEREEAAKSVAGDGLDSRVGKPVQEPLEIGVEVISSGGRGACGSLPQKTVKLDAKAASPDVVVALTADAVCGARDRYLAMGFDDYVSKPIVDHEQFAHLAVGMMERAA